MILQGFFNVKGLVQVCQVWVLLCHTMSNTRIQVLSHSQYASSDEKSH